MCAGGDDLSAVEDEDAVCAAHGGDTLRDDDLCARRPRSVERFIKRCLGHEIECACRIIEDHDIRISEDRPRQRKTLSLTPGEIHAAFSEDRIIPVRETLDEFRSLRDLRSLSDIAAGIAETGDDGSA